MGEDRTGRVMWPDSDIIGGYRLLERLGASAGARMARARRPEDPAPVLLRLVEPTAAAQATRFRREFELLQSLDVPGVPRPLAFFSDPPYLGMALEDFPGEPLETLLQGRRLSLPLSLRLASELAGLLAGLHAAEVIHQDLRPANLLLDVEGGRLCLVDFSLAVRQGRGTRAPLRASLLEGDLAYLSPERTGRMNRAMDDRSDLYSLGVTLYRLFTGRLPFAASDPLEWVHCHIARVPPSLTQVDPAIPGLLSDIVMRLLAKEAGDRYQTARGLRHDLERCLSQWHEKGKLEPFPLAEHDISGRLEIPQKLYGREEAVGELLAAFERVVDTGSPELVLVSGYSGIGKSALVNELHKPVVRERGFFISGKFDQYKRNIPYSTIAQAFRELVIEILAESEERVAAWKQRLLDALGVNGQLIVDMIPQVELVIDRQPKVAELPPIEAQNRLRSVFQHFIGVFARKEHPLALFLDDLQWADLASLGLLEGLMIHRETGHLLVIGAYRDNEVTPSHPLLLALDKLRKEGARVSDIVLGPLSREHLVTLVSDTLHCRREDAAPLSDLIHEKTAGNPFFAIQFLTALHEEHLIEFDWHAGAFRWDVAKAREKGFTDNVVDLVVGKLARLPESTQGALKTLACLGNIAEVAVLAAVSDRSEEASHADLSEAVRAGLILRMDDTYKFPHDRIQEAAYSLIPAGERAAAHLEIGWLLLSRTQPAELEEKIFEIVNHFDRGAALITSREERERVAELNLLAGKRAKASVAYASALTYLAAGSALLAAEDSWDRQYELFFALELNWAECEYLTGAFEAADERLSALTRKAKDVIDAAAIACTQAALYTTQTRQDRAIDTGLHYLRHIGIAWSPRPTREDVRHEYERIRGQLGSRPIEEILDLPQMRDARWQATMDVLTALVIPAAYSDEQLLCLVVCRMVNLSLEHGNCDGSCFAYGFLGILLGPFFGDYPTGFRFGKLGLELLEKRQQIRFRATVYGCFGMSITPWSKPLRSGLEWLRRAFNAAAETGDLLIACGSCSGRITLLLAAGEPLADVQREAERSLAFTRKARFGLFVDVLIAMERLIRTLRGLTTSFSSFDDEQFDENQYEAHLAGDPTLVMARCWYWIRKLQARFYAGDYAAAVAAAAEAEPILWVTGYVFERAEYHFYRALALAAHHDEASPDDRRSYREALLAHLRQLEVWASSCPENFGNRVALVAAENARIGGEAEKAAQLYEQAIRSARENGFVQNEAIAYETASRFYRARGFDKIADMYLREARACYARWGADGKVKQLERQHPELVEQKPLELSAVATRPEQIDVLSVVKASQAISGEIVLDRLLDTLMRTVIENAGARRGCLLLARGETLSLGAEAKAAESQVEVRIPHEPEAPPSDLPASLLNYVRRSREKVILDDGRARNPIIAGEHLSRRPKSALCLPILRQAELVGLLYLENDLVAGAFTPDRLAVLELLSSQAAISIANATLYADLLQENSERRRAEQAVRDSKDLLQSIVDNSTAVIYLKDAEGRYLMINRRYAELFHVGEQAIVDRTDYDVFPRERADAFRAVDQEVLATGTALQAEEEVPQDDGLHTYISLKYPLCNAAGQPYAVCNISTDITERKQAEAERQARKTAEAESRAKTEFLRNMSHELRTPLNAILGYAQILKRSSGLEDRQAAGLNTIQQSGQHLLTLINDLLDLAKIEAGKLELYPEPIHLSAFLTVVAHVIRVRAEQKSLHFVYEVTPHLPQAALADEKRLRQVLLNLLGNAVKFTDRGRVRFGVQVLAQDGTGARLRFEVEDTGVGMAPEQLAKLFQPFGRVGEVRRRAGTGLGLMISRQLVNLMGSEIHVESRPDEGSRFWFEVTLPVAEIAAPLRPKQLAIGYAGPRRKVLVADDVVSNRAVLSTLLIGLGFEVCEAANGQEAVEQEMAASPELAVMDLVMPVMGGLDAIHCIRRDRQARGLPRLPFIVVSASANEEDQAESIAAGADAFLTKPIDQESLLHILGTQLGLTWVHAKAAEERAGDGEATELVAPPREEMEVLHAMALEGNMRNIRQRAAYLATLDERYRPFADRLHRLAQAFQSKAILRLIEEHLQGASPSARLGLAGSGAWLRPTGARKAEG
ncbi:AAA family ATPase [Sorangium sp. So ce1128]